MKKFRATAVAAAIAAAVGVGWYASRPPPDPAVAAGYAPLPKAPSLLGAGGDADGRAASEPVVAATRPAGALPGKPAAALHPKDAEFVRLSASKDLAERARAYKMASDCMAQAGGVENHQQSANFCGVAPGHWQDTQLRKQLLAAVVERAEFGGLVKLRAERTQAFADDPQGYAALLARARVVGLEQAEPTALLAESGTLYQKASFAADVERDLAQAKSLYRQSLAASIAAEVNTERRYCAISAAYTPQCPNVSVDLAKTWGSSPLATAQFSAAEQKAIVQDGIQWANKRKDHSS